MAKFEAHITCPRDEANQIKMVLDFYETRSIGWKYSAFDADPIMGDKPFAYLTAYDTNARTLLDRTEALVEYLKESHVTVLRSKIERIIYDTKTHIDEICHA